MTMSKILFRLLSVPSESGNCEKMQEFLIKHCRKRDYEVEKDKIGNLYVTKDASESYPCIVAHMDTVHAIELGGIMPIELKGRYVTAINPRTKEQTGVGGDDKCGIYAALRLLDSLAYCKAAFFVDEEIGCVGSNRADISFFKDCRFVLQADRRGNDDWVTGISGPLGSDDFQNAVAPILHNYGYKPCNGMMTDVMALRDLDVGVSVANMSAGYYNPHTSKEYISLKDLDRVVAMMHNICLSMTDRYPFIAPSNSWLDDDLMARIERYYRGRGRSRPKIHEQSSGWPEFNGGGLCEEYCSNCLDVFPTDSMVQYGEFTFLCPLCNKEHSHNFTK